MNNCHPGLHELLKQSVFVVLTFPLLILTGCSASTSIEKPLSDLAAYQNQKLDWATCYEDFECTDLRVPIDYADLTVGTFKIAVLRYKAQDPKNRIGSLIVNPGGPGGSGVDYAYNAEYVFDPDVLDRYDIVGFDPRGVNRSAPIECLTDEETDANYASDAKPDTEAELEQALADSKEFIQKCESTNEHLTHYSTAAAARDMDILRAALGDKKLNYFGKSYGTYLGTLYAQFFPEKVGRMILDGALDPNISILEQNISQAKGFDDALDAFLADCAKQDDCPLPDNKQEATLKIITLFETAALSPLPRKTKAENDERTATESLIVLGTASALYDDVDGWPKLRNAFREGQQGYGDTFLDLADQYTGRSSDGSYMSNELDSGAIIDCLDWPNTRSVEKTKADAKRFTDAAPVFGPYLAYTNISCKYLTPPTKDKLTRTTNKITSIKTAPVIVIGTTRDPATPYEWSVGLHQIFKNSKLISLDADGHTGQGRGSACVDDAVTNYLIANSTNLSDIKCQLSS
jgi:pimeloyl-ACP methyl ester carboxylesterase